MQDSIEALTRNSPINIQGSSFNQIFSPLLQQNGLQLAHIKVPACDTELFEGGYEEYPSFREMVTVDGLNQPKLTPDQKLHHIHNKTKGSPCAILKRYVLNDAN